MPSDSRHVEVKLADSDLKVTSLRVGLHTGIAATLIEHAYYDSEEKKVNLDLEMYNSFLIL